MKKIVISVLAVYLFFFSVGVKEVNAKEKRNTKIGNTVEILDSGSSFLSSFLSRFRCMDFAKAFLKLIEPRLEFLFIKSV